MSSKQYLKNEDFDSILMALPVLRVLGQNFELQFQGGHLLQKVVQSTTSEYKILMKKALFCYANFNSGSKRLLIGSVQGIENMDNQAQFY